jgi:hypothetical protein
MKFEEILGFHGLVLRTDRLEEDARRWSEALGLPVLRRTAHAIVLGSGPEFFLELRRVRGDASAGMQEVHVAVRGLPGAPGRPDALGGIRVARTIGETTLVVREFVGPCSRAWRAVRRRPRRRPGSSL